MLFTTTFWRAAAERAIRTFAQTLAAVLATGATGLLDVDWVSALSAAALAALLSALTSVAAVSITGDGPSLANEEVVDSDDDVAYPQEADEASWLLEDNTDFPADADPSSGKVPVDTEDE